MTQPRLVVRMAQDPKLKSLFTEFTKALADRDAAMFIGAGLSADAGFPTWHELLREVASELQLDIDQETDLVALAQYHVNEQGGVRSALDQRVRDAYDRPAELPENHRLIARLPLDTVWTTNYDHLIEDAFQAVGKRMDVKRTTRQFGSAVRGRDVTIYKMHGDASEPSEAVLTKEDYEYYNTDREVFTNALKGDLVNKTFLFLGFSFTDPNIDYVLSRIRVLMRQNPRQHFCVMRRPVQQSRSSEDRAQFDYDTRRLDLRIGDMKRFGIRTILIDDYQEITDILRELNRRAHHNNIFVSGSSHDRRTEESEQLDRLANHLGRAVIQNRLNLVSGFGLGIGNAVLTGALEEVYRDPRAIVADRVLVRPFPQSAPGELASATMYTTYRKDMLSQVGYVVFLAGTKLDVTTQQAVPASGVLEEFAIAAALDKYPIPIGATGGAAQEIWGQVTADPMRYFRNVAVGSELTTLGDATSSEDALIAAVLSIIRRTRDK